MSRSSALVVVMPDQFFSRDWLDLLELHFQSYGPIASWTPLSKFSRVILVYQKEEDAMKAKKEMDHFVWDPSIDPTPMRLFSAPALLQQSQEKLAPPLLEKNFLISPPGSPPVGWEQIQEDEPNKETFPSGTDDEWVRELERALRFLSVGEAGYPEEQEGAGEGEAKVILQSQDDEKPAITISTPPRLADSPRSASPSPASPPSTAPKITQVKATVASLLGPSSLENGSDGSQRRTKIASTPRPPTDDDFSAFADM